MLSRLPKWVETGGFFLAFAAGGVNAIALMGFNHQGVSHLSGSSTLLGVEAASGNGAAVAHLALILGSFVAGAAISGFVIGGESLTLGRRYSVALFGESLLLVGALLLLDSGAVLGHFLASAACGLQNAMTSTYSGAVVRTTHVTGLFTDLGVTLGLRLRGQAADRRRVWLYLALIGGFIAGGVAGAWGFGAWRFHALVAPAVLTAGLGIAVLIYAARERRPP